MIQLHKAEDASHKEEDVGEAPLVCLEGLQDPCERM